MPITAIHVANFKGLLEPRRLELRPLTLFIGANSSGKSSCIHALAALAQTARSENDRRPLVLDDEAALVHLGRFIEVQHTKSYKDTITLGIDVAEVRWSDRSSGGKRPSMQSGTGSCVFTFKCTKRTQEITVIRAEYIVGTHVYSGLPKPRGTIEVLHRGSGKRLRMAQSFGIGMQFAPVRSSDIGIYLDHFLPLTALISEAGSQLRNAVYLGPFRQSPQRRYATRGSAPRDVGPQGEASVALLANETIRTRKRVHKKRVASWLRVLRLAREFEVTRLGSSDLFDVTMTLDDGATLPLADLGYGLSQVLPVLVQCSFAQTGATLLFEQPELHLHPIAAQKLVKVFIETIREKSVRIIAETHSIDLFSQLLRELREGAITLSDVAVYRVERQGSRSIIESVDIDPKTFDAYGLWNKGITAE